MKHDKHAHSQGDPEHEDPALDAEEEEIQRKEKADGLSLFGHSVLREPASRCPQGAASLCKRFTLWSSEPWHLWARQATERYSECKCKGKGLRLPDRFDLACTESGLDCKDVCKAFRQWAFGYRQWAMSITKALHECFDDWSKYPRVPWVPRCGNCEKTCEAMNRFHADLEVWAKAVRYPLNVLCDPGGTDPVPEPPTPPPFM